MNAARGVWSGSTHPGIIPITTLHAVEPFSLTPITHMRSKFISYRNVRSAVSLSLGLCVGNAVCAAPTIQSIDVTPNPLIEEQSFTIAVTASPHGTIATA